MLIYFMVGWYRMNGVSFQVLIKHPSMVGAQSRFVNECVTLGQKQESFLALCICPTECILRRGK